MECGSEVMHRKKVDTPWSIYRVFTAFNLQMPSCIYLKSCAQQLICLVLTIIDAVVVSRLTPVILCIKGQHITAIGLVDTTPVNGALPTLAPLPVHAVACGQRSAHYYPGTVVHLVAGHTEAKVGVARKSGPMNYHVLCVKVKALG